MCPLNKNKFILPITIILTALIVFVFTLPIPVLAGAAADATVSVATKAATTILALEAILYALKTFLLYMLAFSGSLLDIAFNWNLEAIPIQIPIVINVWGVIRDLVNSVFILLLLWIAFTIIFNFEKLGGKKYLVRIIIAALLVNFSLAFVTAVFGFANYLALPFRKAIGEREVSEIIIKNSRIHEVVDKLSQSGVETIKQLKAEAQQASQSSQTAATLNTTPVVLAALGLPPEANAQGAGGVLSRILSSIKTGGKYTLKTTGAVLKRAPDLALALGSIAVSGLIINAEYQNILNLAIASFFLFLTTIAFLIAAITLVGRLIAIVFLSILSPLAFLLFAVPGGFAKKNWDTWLEGVLKWAFYLPAFYLFMYVSLMVLKAGSDGIADLNGFSENVLVVLNLSIFLVFLWASITLARKMGITVADTVLGYTKALALPALGLATGGLAMGAGAIMRQPKMKEWVQEGSKAVSQVPYVGAAMRPVMRKTAEMYAKDRKDVQDLAKQNEHLGPEAKADLLRSYRSVTPLNEKAASAMAKASLEDEKTAKLLTPAEKQRAIELAAKFDLHGDALKLNPNLARKGLVTDAVNDTDAMRRVIEKVRPDEAGKWSKDSITPEVAAEMWKQFTPSHIAQMQRNNPDALTKAMQYDATNAANSYLTPDSMRQMRADTYRYLNTNTLGVRPPPELKTYKPRELAREDAMRAAESTTDKISNFASQKQRLTDQISDLQNKAQRLQNIPGSDKQIRKIREVDVPGIQDKIARLDEDITNLRGTPI